MRSGCELPSKQQLQTELNDPLVLVHHGRDPSLLGRRDVAGREAKIRVIERVKEFGTELQAEALGDSCRFEHSQIHIQIARPAYDAAARVAECPRRVGHKSCRIEPLQQLVIERAAVAQTRIAAEIIGPVAAYAAERVIHAAADSERESALAYQDRVQLPAVDQFVGCLAYIKIRNLP